MIRNWLYKIMAGRYGPDQLFSFLFFTALLLQLISAIPVLWFLRYVALALLIFALYRLLSKNMVRRRAENDRFLRFWGPVKARLRQIPIRLKSLKTHRFFRCPSCGNTLRVPRHKGKIQITCPKCGERFTRKT